MNIDTAVSESEFLRQIYCFEELWSNTQVPMMELYKKEREFGTRVSLDGHAADELFAGYGFDILKAYPDAKNEEEINMITTAYLNQNSEQGIPVGSAEFKRQRNKLYRNYMFKYRAKKLLGRADVKSAYADHPNWKKLDNLNKTQFVPTFRLAGSRSFTAAGQSRSCATPARILCRRRYATAGRSSALTRRFWTGCADRTASSLRTQ